MQKIEQIRGRCLPIDADDVDTDQIIPARHLMRVTRQGLGEHAFEAWSANAVTRDAQRDGAPFLLAGANFGCGSSREHAVWALRDRGVRVVIAESLADIFATNCARFGVLAITLASGTLRILRQAALADARFELEVDLHACELRCKGEPVITFEVDPFVQHCLLEGLDLIGLSMLAELEISSYEASRPAYLPQTTMEATHD